MPLHHESPFETEIREYLGAHGWLDGRAAPRHGIRRLGLKPSGGDRIHVRLP